MDKVSVVGLDLAKNVFQAHGADAEGKKVWSRRLKRADVLQFFAALPPCRAGMEAKVPRIAAAFVNVGERDALLSHFGLLDPADLCQALNCTVIVNHGAQGAMVYRHDGVREQFQGYDAHAHRSSLGVGAAFVAGMIARCLEGVMN